MIAVIIQVSESLSQEKAPVVDIEGTDALGKAEVIDLDDYVFRFCTCSVELVMDPSPPPCVFLSLLAVSSHKRRVEAEVGSPAPPNATKNAAREARRRYTTHRYHRLRKAQLASQALARVNPRQSSRLRATK